MLANLDRDLSWTSELGEAYRNQPDDVMQAIQYMRHKAYDAGNLRSTPQERVYEQGPNVDIQPVNPDVVYVPAYNPAYVYGYPVGLWPGFYPVVGIWRPVHFVRLWFSDHAVLWLRLGMAWMGRRLGLPRWNLIRRPSLCLPRRSIYNHAAFVHGNYRGFSLTEASLPRMAHSERTHMRAHREATRGLPRLAGSNRGAAVNRSAGGNRAYVGNRGYSGGGHASAGHGGGGGHSGGGHGR